MHPKGTLVLTSVIESVKKHPDYSKVGAMAIFIGVVRGETRKSESISRLELEAYDEKANEILDKICQDLKHKRGIVDVQIHHFTGSFKPSEDIVYVLVAGGHRENVFPVLREAVERYKKDAPIFKKEYVMKKKGKSESYWINERRSASTRSRSKHDGH